MAWLGSGRASAEAWSRTAALLLGSMGVEERGDLLREGHGPAVLGGQPASASTACGPVDPFQAFPVAVVLEWPHFQVLCPLLRCPWSSLVTAAPPRPRLGLGTGLCAADSVRQPAVPLAPTLSAGPPLAPAAPRRVPGLQGPHDRPGVLCSPR